MTEQVSQQDTEFVVRCKDEDALRRVLKFCDIHNNSLDLQGFIDGVTTGAIAVIPLWNTQERANVVRVHDALVDVITNVYPTLYRTVRRISAAYRLARILAGETGHQTTPENPPAA